MTCGVRLRRYALRRDNVRLACQPLSAKTLSAEAGNVNGFKKNRILSMHNSAQSRS